MASFGKNSVFWSLFLFARASYLARWIYFTIRLNGFNRRTILSQTKSGPSPPPAFHSTRRHVPGKAPGRELPQMAAALKNAGLTEPIAPFWRRQRSDSIQDFAFALWLNTGLVATVASTGKRRPRSGDPFRRVPMQALYRGVKLDRSCRLALIPGRIIGSCSTV